MSKVWSTGVTLGGMEDFQQATSLDSAHTVSDVGKHWSDTLMERMGMEVTENTAERTVMTMPTVGNLQSAGILHGGASAALAETAASIAANVHAHQIFASDPQATPLAVGTDLNISHIRACTSPYVYAIATAVHLGRSSTVHLVEIRDDENLLVASARVSNRILGHRPGTSRG